MKFTKYTGSGNDFIVLDNRESKFNKNVKQLCHRQHGIGADGVVLLEESNCADYRMRIFNADGSEAEMCGNGLRCLGKFLLDVGLPKQEYTIQVWDINYPVSFSDDQVKISFPISTENIVELTGYLWPLSSLNTGVPHVVAFLDDLEVPNFVEIARNIRHHSLFEPQGTNVNIAKLEGNQIFVRTYERGVEEETLSCGTGAVAVAIIAHKKFQIPNPVQIIPRSHETISINIEDGTIEMIGPAKKVFNGYFCA